jgi:hypothetical protein
MDSRFRGNDRGGDGVKPILGSTRNSGKWFAEDPNPDEPEPNRKNEKGKAAQKGKGR